MDEIPAAELEEMHQLVRHEEAEMCSPQYGTLDCKKCKKLRKLLVRHGEALLDAYSVLNGMAGTL